MTGCIMVSARDRPIYSIKAPTPKVSNRIPHYLVRSPSLYPNPDRTNTIIIVQLA
ncbi:hypothetical protein QUB05_28495 [Microcoleus sp. F10-C6]|uniref:hypothetical protein n=1 Tax=unclassified Microcoleus TaxID=2642155 RepID=UPI002FD39C11